MKHLLLKNLLCVCKQPQLSPPANLAQHFVFYQADILFFHGNQLIFSEDLQQFYRTSGRSGGKIGQVFSLKQLEYFVILSE